jgi:Putative Flp pilus-assembly TadE/G-like
MTALMMVILIGFAGLVIDVGRVWIAQRQLQNAVDAAAAVAGQDMPNSQTAYNDAVAFSGFNTGPSIGKNALNGYGVSSSGGASPSQWSVTFECVSTPAGLPPCNPDTSNDNCKPTGASAPQPAGTTTCNAVKVTETATVKTTFAHLFLPSFTVSASATAGARGGQPHPLDIAVVVDSTASMNDSCGDNVPGIPNGRADKIDCAKEGVRTLLDGLWPCDSSYQSCTAAPPLDETSLLTFPALSSPNAFTHDKTNTQTNNALEMQCEGQYSGSGPSWYKPSGGFPDWFLDTSDLTYNGSPSYVVTPLSNDYKSSSTSALSTSSPLVNAVSWNTCPNRLYPGNEYYGLNSRGGVDTYYADAISAAQAELAADSARNAQPVIILLSDGDGNTKSPGQCTRAVQNAQAAAAQGTWVYSVMYGQTSTTAGCSGDGRYSAYTAMKSIASDSSKFFCDPKPVGATCQSAATLNDIFQHIAIDLTNSRLIG